ncbi:MAG: hypothetical protein KatS3mg003_0391 [Candidatus Nitrosocaldaceae archaeon]|nr:MAG: hypothetical protein KatS3mg003_0391 [Candidatus Nitrosocaldaceae archaeon]
MIHKAIINGYNRYNICKGLGIEPEVIVIDTTDELEEKELVIKLNLKRRQLDTIDRCLLAKKLKELKEERARINSMLKQFRDGKADIKEYITSNTKLSEYDNLEALGDLTRQAANVERHDPDSLINFLIKRYQ